MKAIGIDAGSLNIKAFILDDGRMVGASSAPSGNQMDDVARQVISKALGSPWDPAQVCIVATGAGAKSVSFARQQKSMATCLARGFNRLLPSVRTAIDLGAESSTVIKINERGRVSEWANHDKCAAGTGVFLQQMAKLMQIPLQEMSSLALTAASRADISGTCAVFAESEVISHVHRDPPTPKAAIVAGIYAAVLGRILAMCKRLGIQKDVGISGGVALSDGLVSILESELGFKVLRPERPEMLAALGAAIIAAENIEKGTV